jgi:N-acyl-D-aspartate/D-glutamate deacylase
MNARFDLVIRGGTVFDGSGKPGIEADVAVLDGRIAEIGRIDAAGLEEIDAKGRIVTPGFVDIHTHYDGQATWENRLIPSSIHGVTTVVMGNCGVGFAPCRADQHELLIHLMSGVEDIPEVVMSAGIPWNWETYPEYLDALAARRFDIDLGSYMPHAALRLFAMGERACRLEPATDADIETMAGLLRQAIRAGALGLGTSQTINHKSTDGMSIPTLKASKAEYAGLMRAMADLGSGVFQYVTDWEDPAEFPRQFGLLRELAEASGRPITFTLTQRHNRPDNWRWLIDRVDTARAEGLAITAQFYPRPIGIILGHELSLNPFYSTPSYLALAGLSFERRIEALRQPELRARILAEPLDANPPTLLGLRVANYGEIYPLGDPPDYEPLPETSIAALALRRGIPAAELAYDLLLENDGRTLLYMATANYAGRSLDTCFEALSHDGAVVGLGDGGAHLGSICDASYPTFMLTHWVRDRVRGRRQDLATVIETLSSRTAAVVGLLDRGILAPGYRADLNVIDFDRLSLGAPNIAHDLPDGGRRLMQRAAGYTATVVNGAVTYRDGEPTGALPGRLVRGPRAVH